MGTESSGHQYNGTFSNLSIRHYIEGYSSVNGRLHWYYIIESYSIINGDISICMWTFQFTAYMHSKSLSIHYKSVELHVWR